MNVGLFSSFCCLANNLLQNHQWFNSYLLTFILKPFFVPSFTIQDADIKANIRNLRTQYGKEMGKLRASVASGAGTSSVYEPPWRFYNSLHFLRDSITPVKTKPTWGVPEVRLKADFHCCGFRTNVHARKTLNPSIF
jgi:hypothetical protein